MCDACILRTDKLEQHWACQPVVFWQRMVAYKKPWEGVFLLIRFWNNYLLNLNGSLQLPILIASALEQLRDALKMLKFFLRDLDSSWIDNINHKESLAVISALIEAVSSDSSWWVSSYQHQDWNLSPTPLFLCASLLLKTLQFQNLADQLNRVLEDKQSCCLKNNMLSFCHRTAFSINQMLNNWICTHTQLSNFWISIIWSQDRLESISVVSS